MEGSRWFRPQHGNWLECKNFGEKIKKGKYQIFVGKLGVGENKLWHIKMILIAVIVRGLGTIPKSLKRDWVNWRFVGSLKSSILQHYWNSIIIMCCYHGSPWLYCPSLPWGLPGYILYRYRAVVYSFLLVVLPLLVYVKWNIYLKRYNCVWIINRKIWKHVIVYELFVLNNNTWNHMTVKTND